MGKWENRKIGKQEKPECTGLMLNTEESSSHHKYI
jgi:hypothetical protein